MNRLNWRSVRVRLLLVNTSVLFIGFGALSLFAGERISDSARVDYSARLQNEVELIASAIGTSLKQQNLQQPDDTLLAEYAQQVDGTLVYYADNREEGRNRSSFRDQVELETALRGQIIVVERPDTNGNLRFFTASPVKKQDFVVGLIQLSVSVDNLQALIRERWGTIGIIYVVVVSLSLMLALWLAKSIIQPLSALRDATHEIAKGNLAYRLVNTEPNEIGAVAQAFNNMASQVESMLEEQRAFASNASHELRTPLTTVRLRSEALRYDDTLDQDTIQQYVVDIDDEIQRLGTLIEDLTLLSRFDAGRAELGKEQIDVLQFVRSQFIRMKPLAEAKQIQLSLIVPDQLPALKISLNHLTMIFRNVLDNAIKYTPNGGSITWHMMSTNQHLVSKITDTGRGIDAEQLAKVFERFYRADKARSRDIPGSGLGLAIVKSVVSAYHGTIDLHSMGRNLGTTVTITMPVSD